MGSNRESAVYPDGIDLKNNREEDVYEDVTPRSNRAVLLPPTHKVDRRQHEIMVEQAQLRQNLEDQQHTWRSCCLRMDRRAVGYFAQLLFCLLVLVFALAELALHSELEHAQSNEKYVLLVGLITGFQIGISSAHFGDWKKPNRALAVST